MRRSAAGRLVLLLSAGVAGCASILPKAPAKAYFDVQYGTERVACSRSDPSPVEVWSFTAAAPYDRTDMVVVDGREVSFAGDHQWVDRPGVLVAQALMRDLGGDRLVPLVVSPRDPAGAPLELTGTLYRFGWEKEGRSARATLEADVVLRSTGGGARILLQRRYDVDSAPEAATDDASAFARAMSGVVARLSVLVRRDLCTAIVAQATPPAGRGLAGRDGAPARVEPAPRRGREPPPAAAGRDAARRTPP